MSDAEFRAVERAALAGDPEAERSRIRLLEAGRAPPDALAAWATTEKPARDLARECDRALAGINEALDEVQGTRRFGLLSKEDGRRPSSTSCEIPEAGSVSIAGGGGC